MLLANWLGEIWGRKVLILHARLELIGQILDPLVVAAGFYGVKNLNWVSRELCAPSGTLFSVTLPRSVKDS